MWWAVAGLAGSIGGILLQEWFGGDDAPETQNITYNVTLISSGAAVLILGGIGLWLMLKR